MEDKEKSEVVPSLAVRGKMQKILPLGGFPDSSAGKESAYNAGDPSSIPELGRSSGEGIGYPLQYSWAERLHFHFPLSCIAEGNGNPLQCSCLENPMDGEAW